ncbi:MAG: hypothetical protein ABI759_11350 [Candidatus Solibacter sp.]
MSESIHQVHYLRQYSGAINALAGEPLVRVHHGSVAADQRKGARPGIAGRHLGARENGRAVRV